MATELTIGRLAAAAGVNVETIRYYQRCKLFDIPPKLGGGQRRYPADTVKRLRFIKRAQALGFTLSEVSVLLRLDDARACAATRKLAANKLALIKQKITDLASIQRALVGLVKQCDARDSHATCPIICMLVKD